MGFHYLMYEKTSPGIGTATNGPSVNKKSFHGIVHGDGAVAAVFDIMVSNNNEDFLKIAQVSVSGTDNASDGFGHETPWQYYRADLVSISGTNAKAWVMVFE